MKGLFSFLVVPPVMGLAFFVISFAAMRLDRGILLGPLPVSLSGSIVIAYVLSLIFGLPLYFATGIARAGWSGSVLVGVFGGFLAGCLVAAYVCGADVAIETSGWFPLLPLILRNGLVGAVAGAAGACALRLVFVLFDLGRKR